MSSSRIESETLRLVGRPACHLCDVMAEVLDRVLPAYGLEWRKLEVDSDPGLLRLYGDSVPVLLGPAGEIVRVRVSANRLERRLRELGYEPLDSPS